MRSLLGVVSAVSMLLLAAGCGSAGPDDNTSASAAAVDEGTLKTKFHVHPAADGWDRPGRGFGNETLDLLNAYWMARLSAFAYDHDDASLRTDLAGVGLSGSDVEIVSFRAADTDTQLFYVATKDVAVLAFKGTDSKTSLGVDLEVSTDQDLSDDIHHGFDSALLAVWGWSATPSQTASVRDFLLKRHGVVGDGHAPKPLYLTGHSLGGALATLASAWALNDAAEECARTYPADFGAEGGCLAGASSRPRIDVRGVYTFGSPRVGSLDFATRLASGLRDADATMFRFVDGVDPVPRVPARSDGYHHVGHVDEGDFLAAFSPSSTGLRTGSNALAEESLPDLSFAGLAVSAFGDALPVDALIVGSQAASHALERYTDGLVSELRKGTAAIAIPSVPPSYVPLANDVCSDEQARCMPDRECHTIVACLADACAPGDTGCVTGCHSFAQSAASRTAADAWVACAARR